MSQPRNAAIAHHEAGQAIIARLLGARVSKIVLSEENQEEGVANADRNGLTPDAILFQILLCRIAC